MWVYLAIREPPEGKKDSALQLLHEPDVGIILAP
jgi:hypothetical protein